MNVELILWVKVVRWEGGSWNPVHSASQQSEIDQRYLCGTGVENHRHGRGQRDCPLAPAASDPSSCSCHCR